ncbi:ornithine cyclodeaminase family protein [Pseudaminobacter soli (ex Li et al. 2025)]|uniref:Ornithine cyclodeaminase family protein n=1 Tax=Pseudaminobacter soli (ex Li et al. 2025) TaxID=1295366 RepID=A0A2P7S0T5_9HYPH|nr:ornithine cyclodeaminase family protein [Mesorhizobium soli]PSJ56056.1 ornithine cyclodeaminase family protein [Mesorhizobium soli]
MKIIDARQAADALAYGALIDELAKGFAVGCESPERHHHTIESRVLPDSTLLLMPAWDYEQMDRRYLGIKIVSVCPGNSSRNLPGLTSTYILCDADTGQQLAFIDGNTITARRTAATAALGAHYLSREDSSRLLLIGSGKVASLVPDALRAIRPITEVAVWDINASAAKDLVHRLNDGGFKARLVEDLEREVGAADIVSAATLAIDPIIRGEWLSEGTHVDLIGSFTPNMREADDAVMQRATIYVDRPEALKEAGDLIQPLQCGAITEDQIVGALQDLCRNQCVARTSARQITLFKAVGSSLADLVAARMVYASVQG